MMQVQIQSLNSNHNRKDFDCGSAELNRWLAAMAGQQAAKFMAKTFVAVDPTLPNTILGFYALAVSELDKASFPPQLKQYPQRVPVARLGRFAVSKSLQGQGLGELLLFNALERIAKVAHEIAMAAIVVDAKNAKAAAFYAKYGFLPTPDKPLQLVLPMKTISKLFQLRD